ncbi:MAG: hypothetical protein ACD_45C00208G0002 [uncultured bacterium]|nr:MAG: hypothetical protein ACD_45C00208G0002 [uncultured bacterium]OGT57489.1 MAG: hypothetical protein A3F43_04715 [Gammaproteobacteria bacterium RIFCSPHIGHO2_12_FULL_42_10]
MSCEKSKYHTSLCPCAFGLALGLTSAIAILVWSIWMMYYGVPSAMAGHVMVPASAAEVVVWMAIALLKGFIFGFVLIALYNCIGGHKSRCKTSCGKGGNSGCGCGNPNCNCK